MLERMLERTPALVDAIMRDLPPPAAGMFRRRARCVGHGMERASQARVSPLLFARCHAAKDPSRRNYQHVTCLNGCAGNGCVCVQMSVKG